MKNCLRKIKEILSLDVRWIFSGRIQKPMAENPLRVQAKVDELNLAEARGAGAFTAIQPNVPVVWQAVPGYFVFTGFDFNKGKGAAIFNANFGVPVKVFQNSRTGEMKTFSAYLFETN